MKLLDLVTINSKNKAVAEKYLNDVKCEHKALTLEDTMFNKLMAFVENDLEFKCFKGNGTLTITEKLKSIERQFETYTLTFLGFFFKEYTIEVNAISIQVYTTIHGETHKSIMELKTDDCNAPRKPTALAVG